MKTKFIMLVMSIISFTASFVKAQDTLSFSLAEIKELVKQSRAKNDTGFFIVRPLFSLADYSKVISWDSLEQDDAIAKGLREVNVQTGYIKNGGEYSLYKPDTVTVIELPVYPEQMGLYSHPIKARFHQQFKFNYKR